jgi:hypothetical protein
MCTVESSGQILLAQRRDSDVCMTMVVKLGVPKRAENILTI